LSQTTFGASAFDRALARIGGTFQFDRVRDSQQLSPSCATRVDAFDACAGGLFFLSALNVRASMINTLDRMFAARKSDLQLRLRIRTSSKDSEGGEQHAGVKRAEGWFT
jgi:hypothetical protein